MLCKLAWGNVRRAGSDYLIYLLTLTIGVVMFYAFNTISLQINYTGITDQSLVPFTSSLIGGLTMFLAVVMGFLMVYANNFIMKRRKKEFGLCQVLGMTRSQIARMMTLETLLVSGVAFVLGIVLGIGLSQLMTLLTAALFGTTIASFHFFFSVPAFFITLMCMAATFLVTLVFNLRVVARAKIIDLMSASRRHERVQIRNPWIGAIVFIVGAILVGIAYSRLLADGLPIYGKSDGLERFAVTTAIVIVGTLLVFFGFSSLMLRALSFVRGLYWRGLTMFTLRQISAKVNTVSISMAVIAMVLFLAATSVSGGMSIASSMAESAERSTPADYSRAFMYLDARHAESQVEQEGGTYPFTKHPIDLMADTRYERPDGTVFDLAKIAGDTVQFEVYCAMRQDSESGIPELSYGGLAKQVGVDLPPEMKYSNVDVLGIDLMRESDYNRYLAFRGLPSVSVGRDGYILTSDGGGIMNSVYDEALKKKEPIELSGHRLHPVNEKIDAATSVFHNAQTTNPGTLIVPDAVIDNSNYCLMESNLLMRYRDGITTKEGDDYVAQGADAPESALTDIGFWTNDATRTSIVESSGTFKGLISYLALYIGFVLVIASAAILAIQQLSNVSDTGSAYRVLSEIGVARRQVMRSVLIQQAVFFLLPLVVATAHSYVALKVVTRIALLFGGLSIAGTVALTLGIFVTAYGGYFLITYLTSRRIVHDAIRVRHTL
ncbi:ABC transporter permease [Collinsella sp. AGMB00827]|uniref:ABC transporter permease n=1 Tax=Collinsella ureilytica TaxID=2869515 RepID=A0ABS7MII2_9ACTN|nr:ABC transporter permease [Collinsella urealyticum]MBY4797178.1 ABC transporter permease [Collinsella urealyticum]